jgi:hypothetical protein
MSTSDEEEEGIPISWKKNLISNVTLKKSCN